MSVRFGKVVFECIGENRRHATDTVFKPLEQASQPLAFGRICRLRRILITVILLCRERSPCASDKQGGSSHQARVH